MKARLTCLEDMGCLMFRGFSESPWLNRDVQSGPEYSIEQEGRWAPNHLLSLTSSSLQHILVTVYHFK